MFSSVANMNGNSLTTGWIVEFLMVLGFFLKYKKKTRNISNSKDIVRKDYRFHEKPISDTFSPVTNLSPKSSQQKFLRTTIAITIGFVCVSKKPLKEFFLFY